MHVLEATGNFHMHKFQLIKMENIERVTLIKYISNKCLEDIHVSESL